MFFRHVMIFRALFATAAVFALLPACGGSDAGDGGPAASAGDNGLPADVTGGVEDSGVPDVGDSGDGADAAAPDGAGAAGGVDGSAAEDGAGAGDAALDGGQEDGGETPDAGGIADGGADSGPDGGGLKTARKLVAGPNHGCVLFTDGTVTCWGQRGPWLGGGLVNPDFFVRVQGIDDAVDISATSNSASGSGDHTCVIVADRSVKCWGTGKNGQLGDGNTSDAHVPVSVQGLSDVASIGVGGDHTCASLFDGTVRCWGFNDSGQLGVGNNTGPEACSGKGCSRTPVQVGALAGAAAVSAGTWHSCALLGDGTIRCWGDRAGGGEVGDGCSQLAPPNGCGPIAPSPVVVAGLSTAEKVSATGGNHVCALLAGGSLACWGSNVYEAIAQPYDVLKAMYMSPSPIPGVSGATDVSGGGFHVCAVSGGEVVCWGGNNNGQLGIGTNVGPDTCGIQSCNDVPTAVSGIQNAVSVASGNMFTCALLDDGDIKCWGQNAKGQLGTGGTNGPESCTDVGVQVSCSTVPVSVSPELFGGAPIEDGGTAADAGAPADGGPGLDASSGGDGGACAGGSAIPGFDPSCAQLGKPPHGWVCPMFDPPAGCVELQPQTSYYCCP